MNIRECLGKGYLKRIKPDKRLVKKELDESGYDLKRANDNLRKGDYKWSIIAGYYSMFHAARALLFSLGYKEKRHFAINIVLEDLVKKGKLESIHLDYFSSAMEAREGADYSYKYSKEIAEDILEYAKKFTSEMKKLI
jgi:uncharacterized protein (UPF0332 family)